MFKNNTPLDIMDREIDDVVDLVHDKPGCKLPPPKIRMNYVKMLYDVLDLDLTPDVALASISSESSKLVISTAGSGKTTWSQVVAVMMKLIMPSKSGKGKVKGDNILSLVYNKHNVEDMELRHKQFVTRLRVAGIKGLDIDDHIHACTMHSFCEFWRKQYTAQLGLVGFSLIEDNQSIPMMHRSINLAKKLLNSPANLVVNEKNMLSFYNLCKESFKTPEQMTETDKFKDLGVDIEFVDKCFERYEVAKKLKRKYDYCDMLVKVYELLRDDKDALKFVQRYYDYIIVDEVQDFTPVMWKLLQLFVSDGTPLTCIGDEDQLIYQFRGASIKELLHFEENFSDSGVYTLTQNRRCRKAILDEALYAISQNTLRFDKSLVGVKPGGSVELVPYNSTDGQIINVVESIKKMDPDEQRSTVICFREQMCSQLLADMLEENNVPYNSIQNILPFSHELFKHVFDVLNALEMPYDRNASIKLYKVLPCKKNELFSVFDYDAEHRKFTTEETHKHFAEYDYGKMMASSGFEKVMRRLIAISQKIDTEPMCNYFNQVYALLCKYFWAFKKSLKVAKVDDSYDDLFEERVKKFFNSKLTFYDFYDEYTKRVSVCRSNNSSKAGVTISTFHGLKGLEFKHVYVIFLDDKIFPNFSLIDSREYSKDVTLELKESETRLWYVTLTRAIDDLHLYYSKSNPSYYVQRILNRNHDSGSAVETGTMQMDAFDASFLDGDDDFESSEDFEDDFSVDAEEVVEEVVEVEPVKVEEPDYTVPEVETKTRVYGRKNELLSKLIANL